MRSHASHTHWLAALFCALLLPVIAGCASRTPVPTPTPPPTDTPRPSHTPRPTRTPTPTATLTLTPSPTPSPTRGPGLDDLMLTPAALEDAGEFDAALETYAGIAGLYPSESSPRVAQAALARRMGDWEGAARYLRDAVDVDPTDVETVRQLALLLDQLGEYEDLIGVYTHLLNLEPDNVDVLIARALVHARLGRADPAVADLGEVQALDPYRQYAWLNVVGAAYSERHYEAAVEIASAGLDVLPDMGGLYLMRGLARLSLFEDEDALDDFSEAIRLDGRDYTALHWRGRALVRLERYDEALHDLRRAGEIGVETGVTGIGQAFEAMADAADVLALTDPDAGFAYLADPIIEYGSRPPLLVGIARCYWRKGNGTQALLYLDSLVREGHIPALFWRAQVHLDYRREYEAIQDLRAYLAVYHAGPIPEEARALLADLDVEETPDEEE